MGGMPDLWWLVGSNTVNVDIFACIKPIFDAKPFALGSFASPNAKDSTFALPSAKYTNMLVSLALGDTNFLHLPCTFFFFFL